MFSFLPLAHMFERLMETAAFMVGMRVGYYGGNIKTVVDDIKELKPTVLPLVPRVLNRIYDKVRRFLFRSYCIFSQIYPQICIDLLVSAYLPGNFKSGTAKPKVRKFNGDDALVSGSSYTFLCMDPSIVRAVTDV